MPVAWKWRIQALRKVALRPYLRSKITLQSSSFPLPTSGSSRRTLRPCRSQAQASPRPSGASRSLLLQRPCRRSPRRRS